MVGRGEDKVSSREKLKHDEDSGTSTQAEPFLIHGPSAEAYKEIGGGVLKDEGGSGLLGGSGKNHEQNPKQSGEGNQDEGKQEGGMTEAESEQDEEGAHEGNPDVPKSYKQAHPSHPSHTHQDRKSVV